MSQNKSQEFKLENILLVQSSFDANMPYMDDMKKFARITIQKNVAIDSRNDKKLYFAFPKIIVSLVDSRKQEKKQGGMILTIKIEYFLAFKVTSKKKPSEIRKLFRDVAIRTVWPFFSRDVIDYTTKAGFSPIYMNMEDDIDKI